MYSIELIPAVVVWAVTIITFGLGGLMGYCAGQK